VVRVTHPAAWSGRRKWSGADNQSWKNLKILRLRSEFGEQNVYQVELPEGWDVILIRSQGQLGNQMFLYAAALKQRREWEWLVLFGFVELEPLIASTRKRVFLIPFPHTFDQWVKRQFKRMARLNRRMCRSVRESGGDLFALTRGKHCLCPLVFEFGLCQSPELAPVSLIHDHMGLGRAKPTWLVQSEADLSSLGVDLENFAFLHFRKGDYSSFDVGGFNPVLPAEYFRDAIVALRKDFPDLYIVVLSDDLEAAKEFLGREENFTFFPFGSLSSFGAMVLARHGILSASTFSWWGARLAHDRHGGGTFIAPLYWMGFRTQTWFPSENIRSDFLSYIEVAS